MGISMIDIKVSKVGHDLNEREQKILEVLLLNIAAHANAQVTGANMMFTPLEKSQSDIIFSFQFAWQKAITEDQWPELKEGIEKRFSNALLMSDIKDTLITFEENTYLAAK